MQVLWVFGEEKKGVLGALPYRFVDVFLAI
jgi:hypothetical protein